MFLKIHLLQVMSIGLLTVPIKAQEPTLAEIPELYMEERDKAILNSIWNMAGFPSEQNEGKPEVTRKFLSILTKVGPGVLKNVIPHLGKIPGFPDQIKPVLPLLTSLIPSRRMTDLTEIKQNANNNPQQTRKPSDSELDSSEEDDSPELISKRRAVHLENAGLEISNENNKKANAIYHATKNLLTSPQYLEAFNLTMEQIKRMIGIDDNIHNNQKSRNFLQRKNINGGEDSYDITTEVNIPSRSRKNHGPLDVVHIGPHHGEVDLEKRNSHMDHMHKTEYKTANTARNLEPSSHHPTGVGHKCAVKREDSSGTLDKAPAMPDNNPMIHNFDRYNPIVHQHSNGMQTYMFQ